VCNGPSRGAHHCIQAVQLVVLRKHLVRHTLAKGVITRKQLTDEAMLAPGRWCKEQGPRIAETAVAMDDTQG
jgi:hypothetical protein